ncbi:MAG: phosphate ABC transporter permease PstA [Cytophagales bacterium]|nr:MAG: phosphate ABC transporter permease PstA [Cytophagales bacterium]
MKFKAKFIEERIFKILMITSTSIILLSLGAILGSILYKGLPSLSWEMISQTPKGGFYLGKSGGILNAILGSFYIAFGATAIALLVSLPVALYINIYRKKFSKYSNLVRLCLDVLWGVPSIVYGALGFSVMLYIGLKTSLLAGIIIVGILIIPVMIRAMDEVIKTIPKGLVEASLALGSTKTETAFKIVVKQALPGIITAILLSFGRAIGDAASVMYTTGFTDNIPKSLLSQAATLPLAIMNLVSSPIVEVQNKAYASALILTFIILFLSIISRLLSIKYTKNKSH